MDSYKYFMGITQLSLIYEIVEDSFAKFHTLQKSCESAGLEFDEMFGSKNQSELLSKIFEKVAADVYSSHGEEAINPTSDNDPDLYFVDSGHPLEIKVTCGDAWTGGTFSKRPADYLLISWDKETKSNCYVALAHLEKSDWLPGGKNYYGTTYPKKALYEAIEQKRAYSFFGSLEKTKRGHKINKVRVSE